MHWQASQRQPQWLWRIRRCGSSVQGRGSARGRTHWQDEANPAKWRHRKRFGG